MMLQAGAAPRERDQTPSVPPRVLLDDLQFEEEGESPMGDAPSVTYSPPNTRRAQSAGGSSSTSAGDIPAALVQPPPSAAAAAAAAAGDDCGECTNCRDKPKFGGPGTKRKGCLVRRDTKPLRPSGLSVSAVGTPPVASMLANKSPRREAPFTGGSADSVSVSQTPDADDSDALASGALAEPSSDPGDDCGVCVTCLDKRKFGGRGIKRKGCLRKKEVTDAMRGVAHPSHSVHADQEDEGPASRSTEQPRDIACETPATVDALAGQPSSGAASEEPRAYEKRLRLRAEARGAGKRAASGLSTGSYSAGAASSSAAKSDDDESEADEAPDKAYEAGTDGTPDAPPGDDYDAVHLIGEGLADSPRAPLNELSVNRSVPAPATPQLKTPDLEVAAGGVSPLSEFANILEGSATPANDVSPLFQLANLLEKTPRLPTQMQEQYTSTSPPSDPEMLTQALLAGGLDSPRVDTDTPGQLKNDLRHALQAAQTLSSPHRPMGPPPLPLSFSGANLYNSKARKRKLEHEMDDKEKREYDEGFDDGQDEVEGMFDSFGVHEDADGIKVTDLLDADLLAPRRRPSGSRSKTKEKEKGKPTRCRCDRSGCLKRYCVCFAGGGTCAIDCKCKDCRNDDSTEERKAAREKAVAEMLKKKSNAFTPRVASAASNGGSSDTLHMSGCNCKKSGCRKRYCECFQAGVRCHEKCKCFDCLNPAGSNPLARSLQGATKIIVGGEQAQASRATLVRRDSVESSDFDMSQEVREVRAASPSGSPSKMAALMAAVVDHQSTISPLLSAAPAPAFTPDVAMEARGFREARARATAGDATTGDATTGESSQPHVATGDSACPGSDDSESYSALLRQRLGAMGASTTPVGLSQGTGTPDCALPGRLADFKLSATTPDASAQSQSQSMVTPGPVADFLVSS